MTLWIIRRPSLKQPYAADEGYVVRAPDEKTARSFVGDEKDNNRYSCDVLSPNGDPGVIMKTENFE